MRVVVDEGAGEETGVGFLRGFTRPVVEVGVGEGEAMDLAYEMGAAGEGRKGVGLVFAFRLELFGGVRKGDEEEEK